MLLYSVVTKSGRSIMIDNEPIMDAAFPPGLVEAWEHFFASESTRLRGQDYYNDIFNDSLIFPLQRKNELAGMMKAARTIQPKTVMEIGADKGGGLYHWIKCLPTVENVIACEIRGTPYSEAFTRAFPKINFLWVNDSSYAESTLQEVRSWLYLGKRYITNIDCLFIDGEKSHTNYDFALYRRLVSNEGLVFIHDIQDEYFSTRQRLPGPGTFYREICNRGYKHKEIIDYRDSQVAKNREIAGVPCKTAHEGWLRHWNSKSCGVGVLYMSEGLL